MPQQATRGLNIGVTGHRLNRLSRRDLERLTPHVLPVLARIAEASRARPPTLVSGLAEGADRHLAVLALELGFGLNAVLPFARDVYELDFRGAESRAEYHALLARAEHVVEMSGQPGVSGQAYRRAGHTLLACSDMLIAVWDGGPSRGVGGTADVVAEACRRRMPVVHVPTQAEAAPALIWRRSGRAVREPDELLVGADGLSRLTAVVSHLTKAAA